MIGPFVIMAGAAAMPIALPALPPPAVLGFVPAERGQSAGPLPTFGAGTAAAVAKITDDGKFQPCNVVHGTASAVIKLDCSTLGAIPFTAILGRPLGDFMSVGIIVNVALGYVYRRTQAAEGSLAVDFIGVLTINDGGVIVDCLRAGAAQSPSQFANACAFVAIGKQVAVATPGIARHATITARIYGFLRSSADAHQPADQSGGYQPVSRRPPRRFL